MKLSSLLPVLIFGLFLYFPLSAVAQERARWSQETKTAKELAREFYEKARALEKQKKYRDAIENYTASIDLDPDNPTVYVSRGDAKFQLENFREAIEDYDKAIRIYISWEPKNPKVKAVQGGGHVTLEEFEDIQAHPKTYEARRALGSVYLRRGLARESTGEKVGACTDFRESCRWDEIGCKDAERLCSNKSADARTTPDTGGTQRRSVSSGLEGTKWQTPSLGEIYSPILDRALSRQFFCAFEKQGRVICSVIATASSKIIYVSKYDVNRRRIEPKPERLPSMTLPTERRVGTYTQNGNSVHIELSAYEIKTTVQDNSMEGSITFKLESGQKAKWLANRIIGEN